MGVHTHRGHAVGGGPLAGESEERAHDAPAATDRIHSAAVHGGVGAAREPGALEGVVGRLGLGAVAEHTYHPALVQGNVSRTFGHISLPGGAARVPALPLVEPAGGHVGHRGIGDSGHSVNVPGRRDDDLHGSLPALERVAAAPDARA